SFFVSAFFFAGASVFQLQPFPELLFPLNGRPSRESHRLLLSRQPLFGLSLFVFFFFYLHPILPLLLLPLLLLLSLPFVPILFSLLRFLLLLLEFFLLFLPLFLYVLWSLLGYLRRPLHFLLHQYFVLPLLWLLRVLAVSSLQLTHPRFWFLHSPIHQWVPADLQ